MYFALFCFSLDVVPMYLSLKIMWPCIIVSTSFGLARYSLSLSPVVILRLVLYDFIHDLQTFFILFYATYYYHSHVICQKGDWRFFSGVSRASEKPSAL